MSEIDWTIAQALEGQPIDSALHRLREKREATLRIKQNELSAACARAAALRAAIPEDSGAPADVDLDEDGLLAAAWVVLAGKAKSFGHAIQTRHAFPLRHGLTREPVAARAFEALMVLFLMIFLEAAVNAGFFQNAYMFPSAFGALVFSFLVSFANVFVSAMAGYFIGRWKQYGANAADGDAPEFRGPRRRAQWKFGAFVGVMAFFHLTVGAVRAQGTLEGIEHGLSAYADLATTPEALFLVMIGVCMSVLAYHKGRNAFGDAYPGFGEAERAVRAAREDLLDSFDECAGQITARFDEEIRAARKGASGRAKAIAEYNKAVEHCHKLRRELEKMTGDAESALKTEIARLAGHHRAARGDTAPLADQDLAPLISFSGFVDGEIPAFLHTPDTDAQVSALLESKARALKRLSGLLEQILGHEPGEPS